MNSASALTRRSSDVLKPFRMRSRPAAPAKSRKEREVVGMFRKHTGLLTSVHDTVNIQPRGFCPEAFVGHRPGVHGHSDGLLDSISVLLLTTCT